MGCSSSVQEELVPRLPTSSISRIIVLLTPPGFDVTKFIKGFSGAFDYKFVSVGKLVRDEINKNTQYSQVIVDNLEKYRYINDAILQILLKSLVFQGNFMVQFYPKDEQVSIWKKFLKMVDLRLIVIVKQDNSDKQLTEKEAYPQKLKHYKEQRQRLYDMFSKDRILELQALAAQPIIEERLKRPEMEK